MTNGGIRELLFVRTQEEESCPLSVVGVGLARCALALFRNHRQQTTDNRQLFLFHRQQTTDNAFLPLPLLPFKIQNPKFNISLLFPPSPQTSAAPSTPRARRRNQIHIALHIRLPVGCLVSSVIRYGIGRPYPESASCGNTSIFDMLVWFRKKVRTSTQIDISEIACTYVAIEP